MDLFIFSVIVLALTGSIIGVASGLLGIGGGFLMVPVQFWLLSTLGVDPTTAIRVSFGTSLAVVIPTALSSAWGHHCRHCVLVRHLALMAVPAFVGAVLGAILATHAPGKTLETLFGVIVLVAAGTMLVAKTPLHDQEISENKLLYVMWGLVFGVVSGLLGIGGGIVMIPVMTIILRFPMHQAIGTSAVVMLASSVGGVISYIVNGLGVYGLPPYSFGYVNGLQWLILVAASVPMAQIGVRASHALPAQRIKLVFIIVMAIVGLDMIGIFG
ncbi:MAG: sulfite exporter TauE/SafE family protein [Methanoregula sp.]|nr:sulfite exporter TauE/SafE family protein [Methanoregula sp.]